MAVGRGRLVAMVHLYESPKRPIFSVYRIWWTAGLEVPSEQRGSMYYPCLYLFDFSGVKEPLH
jgi:hypothetical protein